MTVKRILLAALAALCLTGAARADEPHVIKMATLAPEGTLWMNLFHEWARNVEQHTGGAVKVKFYAGGAAGDERDFVRKMRLGQMGGAAVTSIGLGLIQSEVRVLEVPMLIQTYDELDHVRAQLDGELRRRFEDKGYVLLGWGDVGPIHLFSNTPLRSRADVLKTKMWEWVDDPISRALFAHLGVRGVPLGVPDVLPSLSTGMIDATAGSPLAVLALQWYTRVRYMTSFHFGQAIGATVLTRREFDRLTAEQQKIVLADAKELERKLLAQIRGENDRALEAMRKAGLQVIDTPAAMQSEFSALALPVRDELEKSLYSHELRARVEKLVADYRSRLARK